MAGNIYAEVIDFSETLKPWQRDALRRHTVSNTLSRTDIVALTDLAYEANLEQEPALAERVDEETTFNNPVIVPISSIHVPSSSAAAPPVTLTKIQHINGVNRLRAGAELTLNPTGLNIIFGLNGVGKSGYTRILKSCCHAKARETIKGDIFLETKPSPRAKVWYRLGDSKLEHEWNPQEDSDNYDLSRVAVYDSHTASVHVGKNPTEMSYTPAGLDLIKNLTTTYEAVSTEAKSRIAALKAQPVPNIFTDAESPQARKALDSLGQVGAIERLKQISTLTSEERHELSNLPQLILDVRTKSKSARLKQSQLEKTNYRTQGNRIRTVSEKVSAAQVEALKTIWMRLNEIEAQQVLEVPHDFTEEPVPGVLSPHWKQMWNAARDFVLTEQEVSAEYSFHESEYCPFCHQGLSDAARARLREFEEAMAADLDTEREELELQESTIITAIRTAVSDDNINTDLFSVLRDEYPREVEKLEQSLELARTLLNTSPDNELTSRESIISLTCPFTYRSTVEEEADKEAPLEPTVSDTLLESAQLLESIASAHDAIIKSVQSESDDSSELANREARYQELNERSKIAEEFNKLQDHHNRLVHIRALENVVSETATRALSNKSRTLIADFASRIAEDFSANTQMIENLSDNAPKSEARLRVKLVPSVTKGVNTISFTMDGAASSKENANGVLSEGELRAVTVSAFLADVSTRDDDSAIIFDDPMNSLDHDFQARIAVRLAEEARRRQVIVFTHNMSFVGALWHEGVEKSYRRQVQAQVPNPSKVEASYVEITRHPELGAGIQLAGTGTPTQGFKNLLNKLEKEIIPEARKYHSDEHEDLNAYSYACVTFASNLRNAWEYAVEEIIINGVVARNQPAVRTGILKTLLAITPGDVAAVDEGMDVNSYFVHSTGDGSQTSLPTPTDMQDRLQNARSWLSDFNKRKAAQQS